MDLHFGCFIGVMYHLMGAGISDKAATSASIRLAAPVPRHARGLSSSRQGCASPSDARLCFLGNNNPDVSVSSSFQLVSTRVHSDSGKADVIHVHCATLMGCR